jgi:hypothetical protein
MKNIFLYQNTTFLISAICAAFLYWLIIPIEYLISGEVSIISWDLKLYLGPVEVIRGIELSLSICLGAFIVSIVRQKLFANKNIFITPITFYNAIHNCAVGTIIIFLIMLPFTDFIYKFRSLEEAQTLDDFAALNGLVSFLLSLCGLLSGLAAIIKYRVSQSQHYLWWVIIAIACSAVGVFSGDKNACAFTFLGFLFGFIYFINGKCKSILAALILSLFGLFSSAPINALKFWIFSDFQDDSIRWFVPPSRMDPSTPFALTINAYSNFKDLNISNFNALDNFINDILLLIPRFVIESRPSSGAADIAMELMNINYKPGYGFGYSPYIDLIVIAGDIGPFILTILIFCFFYICLYFATKFISDSGFSALITVVLSCVFIISQRATLGGTLKISIYCTVILILTYKVGLYLRRFRIVLSESASRVTSRELL